MTRVQKQRWHEPITADRGLLGAYDIPPDMRRTARGVVVRHSHDPHDEALLLDILGLTPTGDTA